MEDLTLWELDHNAISLLPFYKDLLKWCDFVDVIPPTPPTDFIPFPHRPDNISNAPLCSCTDVVNKKQDVVPKVSSPTIEFGKTQLGKHGRADCRPDQLWFGVFQLSSQT